MLVFPGQIAKAAEDAGMKVPENPNDGDSWKAADFPHFNVYCNVQLARPMTLGEHWENAKVVAGLSEDELKSITLEKLIAKGLSYKS